MTDVTGTCVPSSGVIQPSTTIEDGLLGGDILLAVHRIVCYVLTNLSF